MKKNPFLKADDKVIKMYGNTATVIFVQETRQYDESTGAMSTQESRTESAVSISTPSVISEAVADGKNYMVGDLSFDISRLELERVLPDGRTVSVETGVIDLKKDRFVVAGRRYRIVKMHPKNMWADTPSMYRVQLRAE